MHKTGDKVKVEGVITQVQHCQGEEHNLCIATTEGTELWVMDNHVKAVKRPNGNNATLATNESKTPAQE